MPLRNVTSFYLLASLFDTSFYVNSSIRTLLNNVYNQGRFLGSSRSVIALEFFTVRVVS